MKTKAVGVRSSSHLHGPLTARQQVILSYLYSFSLEHGYPPTRAEISKHFGFSSSNSAQSHVEALEAKGAIGLLTNLSRGIVLAKENAQA